MAIVTIYIKKKQVNVKIPLPYTESPSINKTSPCNEHTLTPHFYIVKLGFTGVAIHFFLIFALKHRLWVLTIYALSKNKKNITIFHLKISIFTAVENRSMLHGRVFVMEPHLLC